MWILRWALAVVIGFAVHTNNAGTSPEELSVPSCEIDHSLLQISQRGMLSDVSLIAPSNNYAPQPFKKQPKRSDLPPELQHDLANIQQGELHIRNVFVSLCLCSVLLSAVVTQLSVVDWRSQRKKQRLPHAKPLCAESLQPLREKLLCDLIEGYDSEFIIAVDGRQSLSYGRLRDFLNSDRSDISRFGVTEGDRLALLLGSGPEAAVVLFALTTQCAVMPLDPRLPDKELAFSLQDLPAKAVVTTEEHACKVLSHQVVLLRPDHATAGLYSLEANLSPMQASRPSQDSVALLLHTSGTTKKPKLVPLSHTSLILGAHCTQETLELSSKDRCLNMLPLYHVGGISCNILGTAAAKASVVCGPHFNAADAIQWMQRCEPSWYYATPTMHQLLMGQLQHEQSACSLKFIRNASAALLPSVAVRMQETFGCLILPTYGMTECVPICSHRRGALVQIASVGLPCNPEVRISDEGEILIRGPGVTSGYEMRPHWEEDPNLQAFAEGWFRTGDMGTEAPDGYMFISGRSKEIINRGGEKISPFQVEEAMRDPRVLEMVAFSLPHEELGEEVAIAVKLSVKLEGAEPGLSLFALLESLREGASGTLAEKWLPEVLVHVDEIPRTCAGKTARVGLAGRFGLPRGSLASAGYRIYVWRKGSLIALQSPQAEQPTSTMDSLGISFRGKDSLSVDQRQLVMAMYTVAIYLIVVHHQVSIFGDTSTLPFMPPWAIAVLETLTRTMGARWRLVLITICSGYVNAAEALNRWRVLIFIVMYLALMWPIKPAAEWLSSTITGLPNGACHANVGHRYFLPVILASQVLLEFGRLFPYPGLQCIGTSIAAVLIHTVTFVRWQQVWAFLPDSFRSWIEPPWAGVDTCVLYMAVYLAVGYYGMPVASLYTTNPRFKSPTARIAASVLAFSVLSLLFLAQAWNTMPFFQHYHQVYDQLEQKPQWYELPSQKAMNDLIRLKMLPLTTVNWCLDAIYSVMLFPILAVAIAPMAPWLSQFGQYAWGVFCAQGLLFYCNCGPSDWKSFGIMVRGVVLLPSLQSMIAMMSGYGFLQLLLIAQYAMGSILVVCVPFQACYLFLVRGLHAVWRTRATKGV